MDYTFHEKCAIDALNQAVKAIENGHFNTAESLAGDALQHLYLLQGVRLP